MILGNFPQLLHIDGFVFHLFSLFQPLLFRWTFRLCGLVSLYFLASFLLCLVLLSFDFLVVIFWYTVRPQVPLTCESLSCGLGEQEVAHLDPNHLAMVLACPPSILLLPGSHGCGMAQGRASWAWEGQQVELDLVKDQGQR